MSRVRAYVGLGSNVGDSEGTLARALEALDALPLTRLVGVSRLYATRPVGVTDQPEFRNAVAALDVIAPDGGMGASNLLFQLKGLEGRFGRKPRGHWGPRELDLDLLVFGRWKGTLDEPMPLEVPHPEARRRLFVLAPLADLAPGLVPPGWGETVATAAARRRELEGPQAVRQVAIWAGAGWRPSQADAGGRQRK